MEVILELSVANRSDDLCNEICELHKEALKQGCVTHYSQEEIDKWVSAVTPALYKGCVDSIWLAKDPGGKLVGFFRFTSNEIVSLHVHPIYWRKGVATKLVLQEFDRQKVHHTVKVVASLNAQKFYESLGFVPKQIVKHRLGFQLMEMELKM